MRTELTAQGTTQGTTGWKTVADVLLMLPRNAVVVLLRGYRAVISPLYGQVCRYYPSCSAYALEAVQQHGLMKGSVLSGWRVLRCNPWARGGIDDVPERRGGRLGTTRFGFVRARAGEHAVHDHAVHDRVAQVRASEGGSRHHA